MAFTEFYMNSSGSNLNAGSTCSDVGGGSNSAVYTSTAGNFDGTSVFTPTDGSTPASSIAAGDYVSLYNTGDTISRCVAKVVSVAAGANGAVTIDTTLKYGTVPTSNSGSRALKAGGAFADLGITTATGAFTSGTVPQSTRINIKAGTYASTSTTRNLAMNGATTAPLWWRGYKTTPGDQDTNNVAVAGTDIPTLTFTTGLLNIAGNHQTLSNLDVNGAQVTAARGQIWAEGNYCRFYRVRATNTAANANASAWYVAANQQILTACYGTATSSAPVVGVGNVVGADFKACVFAGGNGSIVAILAGSFNAIDCIFDAPQGDALVYVTGGGIVSGCSFYAATGNGINFTGALASVSLIDGNIFSTINQASKAAIMNSSGTNTNFVSIVSNAYWTCTANRSGFAEDFTIFDIGTLASDPFVAASSHNFTLNLVAKGLAFPGLFENTNVYQGYLDPGAVQSQGSAAGGVMINPGMSGGLR